MQSILYTWAVSHNKTKAYGDSSEGRKKVLDSLVADPFFIFSISKIKYVITCVHKMLSHDNTDYLIK